MEIKKTKNGKPDGLNEDLTAQIGHQVELAQFNKRLDQPPKDEQIETRKVSGGRMIRYLPIGHVEALLYEIFGAYQTENYQTRVVANEVVGSVELVVFHPILKKWIRQTGSAAVMIMQTKGAKPSDLDAKYPNALETGAPHLLSDCITNAAKRFGKAFGRDLNRQHKRDFQDPTESSIQQLAELQKKKRILTKSAKALRKYQRLVQKYTDAAELFNAGRTIADQALQEGLLEFDLENLRAFMRAQYDSLIANQTLPEPENSQEIADYLPTNKTAE